MERKNGRQLAERAGDATPDRVQRLLYSYWCDADRFRDDLRGYVVEHLGDANGVPVVDVTGFLKKGDKSAGVPEEAVFRNKPQLAQVMLARAPAAGVPFAWFTGDEFYGSDRKLRLWLESEEIPHVMAVKRSGKLWALTDRGPLQVQADRSVSRVAEPAWVRCSAGNGAKGPRVYDWAAADIRPLREPGQEHWLLARRSIAKPGELACYVCSGPAGTGLEELVRVTGTRGS